MYFLSNVTVVTVLYPACHTLSRLVSPPTFHTPPSLAPVRAERIELCCIPLINKVCTHESDRSQGLIPPVRARPPGQPCTPGPWRVAADRAGIGPARVRHSRFPPPPSGREDH